MIDQNLIRRTGSDVIQSGSWTVVDVAVKSDLFGYDSSLDMAWAKTKIELNISGCCVHIPI